MAQNTVFIDLGLSQQQVNSNVYLQQIQELQSDINSYVPNPSFGFTGSTGSNNNIVGQNDNVNDVGTNNILIGNNLPIINGPSGPTGPSPLSNTSGSVILAAGCTGWDVGTVIPSNSFLLKLDATAGQTGPTGASPAGLYFMGCPPVAAAASGSSTASLPLLYNGVQYYIPLYPSHA